ncbi:MAG: general secretion pathway protein GspB, partial [Candidatus Omnitrophica bacterium]|nr:general secretion pathway protein GspB [Candidatus Omnitrophota bacterium]
VRLEGIVWDEAKGSIAIINGEIVREGQEIGSVKVLKIESDAVVFEVDREEARVELDSD